MTTDFLTAFMGAFFIAFSTMVPVINPFSGAMLFCTMTQNVKHEDRSYMARKIAIYGLIIILVCVFAGHLILSFFGISVGVLRVAGGCVLFAAGWSALNAPSQEELQNDERTQVTYSRNKLKTMAFYPFTLPLTTGPGCIAVSVALGTSLPHDIPNILGTIVASIATTLVIWLCYEFSDRVNKAVGAAGADALARIMAFILLCLGVSVFWQGLSDLLSQVLLPLKGIQ